MEGKSSRLLEQIKKQNYRNYPIKNALLEGETDYIKNNYFRHLALTLTQKGEASENQRYLFSRMLEGVGTEDKIEEYLRQALDIEIGQYIEFMDQLKEKELRYRFLLDAALITCCDVHTEEQEELLACFMESLKLPLAEAGFICEIGRNVLEQDKNRYWELMKVNESFSFRNFAEEYSIEYAGKYLMITSNEMVHWYFPEKKEITRDMIYARNVQGAFNGVREVRIRNAIFDVSAKELTFKECGKIILENCEFRGGKYSIHLVMDGGVEFRDCCFTDFTKRAVVVDCNPESTIRFHQCNFEKCYLYCNINSCLDEWGKYGGVIKSKKECVFYIGNSTFTDCGVVNRSHMSASAIILNQKATVKNCYFKNCRGYIYTEVLSAKENDTCSGSIMFAPGSVNKGNEIIDSAKFSPK